MAYTNATIIIAAADQAAAQVDFPGSFVAGLYEATEGSDPTVATHYVCSGLWSDDNLSKVANDVAWPRRIYFGDAQATLDFLNLKAVEQPIDSQSVV